MIRYLKRGKDAQGRADDDAQVRATVTGILKDIEQRGDEAVRAYSRQFDSWDPASFTLSQADIEAARLKAEAGRAIAAMKPKPEPTQKAA